MLVQMQRSESLICLLRNPEADRSSYADRTDTIIEEFCKDNTSRNAILAKLKLHSIKAVANLDHQNPLVSICEDFFSRYCTKVTCFQDLRPYVLGLGREKQADLLQSMRSSALNRRPAADANDVSRRKSCGCVYPPHSSQAARLYWITAETNTMKFEYHFVTSRDDNIGVQHLLPAFVSNCLRIYKLSLQYDFKLPPSDRLPGDDAAILAAMALVRMYRLRHKNPTWACSLLRCVALLEFANSKSRHNYDILLILIRIYMYLGAGSLALGLWTELSIKNLQHLTISWMLFTRLSTLHPYPVKVPGVDGQLVTIDPFEETVNALDWHRRASQLNSHSMDGFRANGQWIMELDALEAKWALQNGFSKLMLLAESSRMRRFRYPTHQTEEDSVKPIRLSQITSDTRDSAAIPDYEADGQIKFWQICPSVEFAGPTVTNEKWLAANLRQALAWDGLRGIENSIVETNDLESFSRSFDQQENATSNIEEVMFTVGDLIQKCLYQFRPQAAKSGLLSDSIGQLLLLVNALSKEEAQHAPPTKINSPRTHFATDLHSKYCMLEICQFVSKLVEATQKANRSEFWIEKVLADLQAGCKKIVASVWKSAVDLRADVESNAYFDDLFQRCEENDEIGGELNHLLVDPISLHKVIKMIQESWIEAYEGVIKTKVVD